MGKREIARAFGLKGGGKEILKELLREMAEEGLIERRRKCLAAPGSLASVAIVVVTGKTRDGEILAEPSDWDAADHGEPPRILLRSGRGREAGPAPGVGDKVLAKLERVEDEDTHSYVGRAIRVLDRNRGTVLGIYRAGPGGTGRLVPVEKKRLGQELRIAPGAEGEARDGDLVTAEVTRAGRLGLASARVRDRIGSIKNEKAVSLIAILSHEIPYEFAPATLAEAEAARPAGLAARVEPDGREDWRQLPLVTIDPPDAKDHDDAVHAEPDPDPANAGGFVVTVAIADVAHYVRPGSMLDREARERGNSVYFPDRVVPMLPERISNDLCSLRPREDRPALALRMVFGPDGRKRGHEFHRVMMRSAARLSYGQAQAAIDGRPDDVTGPLLEPVLRPLWQAYRALARARDERAPLDLDLPERKILLKPDGTVDRVVVPERLEAHRLIEEFMIQANVAAAETLEARRSPLVYRVHDAPSFSKLEALREFLGSIEIKLPKSGNLRPAHFNQILARVAGSDVDQLVNEVVLRSQAQAEYSNENYGHFGLNLRRYAHFTSPIRRYADLIVHRALIRALDLGPDGLDDRTVSELPEIAAQISAAERRAMAAERDTVDRLIAQHLADRIGADFEGRVSGVTRAGLFVRLMDTGADGFVPAATLGDDYFRYDEANHALVGDRTGEGYRLGDAVSVRLIEAAPVAGALRFEMLSEPRKLARRGSGRRRGARKDGRSLKPGDRNDRNHKVRRAR